MSQRESKKAVVFILLNGSGQVLMEQRPQSSSYSNQIIFPGGTVEESESDDPGKTVVREIQEELGVVATQFESLPCPGQLTSPSCKILLPYLVRRWEGEIPTVVLDKGNPISWHDLETAAQSPQAQVRVLSEALRHHLISHPELDSESQ